MNREEFTIQVFSDKFVDPFNGSNILFGGLEYLYEIAHILMECISGF